MRYRSPSPSLRAMVGTLGARTKDWQGGRSDCPCLLPPNRACSQGGRLCVIPRGYKGEAKTSSSSSSFFLLQGGIASANSSPRGSHIKVEDGKAAKLGGGGGRGRKTMPRRKSRHATQAQLSQDWVNLMPSLAVG